MKREPSRRFRWSGFADAWRGIVFVVRTQANARVHLVATILAAGTGVWLGLTWPEWAAIAAAASGVWVAEAMNTAVETLVDLVSPEQNQLAGWAKDIAAGAVLAAAIGAVIIGALIMGPKLWLRCAG